jgi:hypothetical protein
LKNALYLDLEVALPSSAESAARVPPKPPLREVGAVLGVREFRREVRGNAKEVLQELVHFATEAS